MDHHYHNGSFDRSRFENSEKELSSILHEAQDNIHQVTDDEAAYSSEDEHKFNQEFKSKARLNGHYDRNGNPYQSSSTPLHPRTLKTQNSKYTTPLQSHHHHQQQQQYLSNNPIIKSTLKGSVDSRDSYGQQRTEYYTMYNGAADDESFVSDARSRTSPKGVLTNGHSRHKENLDANSSLILENDELAKENESLRSKFKELSAVNIKNIEINTKFQDRIKELESRLKEEKLASQKARDKEAEHRLHLENQLQSCESQVKGEDSMKKKFHDMILQYEHDLNTMRTEVKKLKAVIHKKDSQSEEMLKTVIEKKVTELKENMEVRLLEDIVVIIQWLNASVQDDHFERLQPPSKDQIRFSANHQLCDYLDNFINERENRLQAQIEEFERSREHLLEALQESMRAPENINALKEHVNFLKEENAKFAQTIKKYKECYFALTKKKDEEIKKAVEKVKDEYSARFKKMLNDHQQNGNL